MKPEAIRADVETMAAVRVGWQEAALRRTVKVAGEEYPVKRVFALQGVWRARAWKGGSLRAPYRCRWLMWVGYIGVDVLAGYPHVDRTVASKQ